MRKKTEEKIMTKMIGLEIGGEVGRGGRGAEGKLVLKRMKPMGKNYIITLHFLRLPSSLAYSSLFIP